MKDILQIKKIDYNINRVHYINNKIYIIMSVKYLCIKNNKEVNFYKNSWKNERDFLI